MRSIRLPAHLASVGAARHFVGDQLDCAGHRDAVDIATLLTSELVTNGILHADSEVEVRVDSDLDHVRVEVVDFGGGIPRAAMPPPEADHGRGLAIVSDLARRWGMTLERDWKTVWFELELSGGDDSFWA